MLLSFFPPTSHSAKHTNCDDGLLVPSSCEETDLKLKNTTAEVLYRLFFIAFCVIQVKKITLSFTDLCSASIINGFAHVYLIKAE